MGVHAKLPGVKDENISLDIKDHLMTIKGIRTSEKEIDQEHDDCKKRRFGFWQRAIPLSEMFDPEHGKATRRDGMLDIRIPQSHSTAMHRITIDSCVPLPF